jgi:Holliday junction DNA helicase RuvA
MFEFIKGILEEKSIGEAVVEAGGVGYALTIPLSTYNKLPPIGQEVKLLTHHHVREDAEKLYGFFSRNERNLFRQIIGISNMGPKTAMSILSGVPAELLIECVKKSDPSRLKKIPGVGEKTAQRLVMELKGKLDSLWASDEAGQGAVIGRTLTSGARSEAFDAMMSLGYGEKQVQAALSRVESVLKNDAPAEEWIKKALQVI